MIRRLIFDCSSWHICLHDARMQTIIWKQNIWSLLNNIVHFHAFKTPQISFNKNDKIAIWNKKAIVENVVFLYLNIEFFTGVIFQDNLSKLLRVRDNIENEVFYPQWCFPKNHKQSQHHLLGTIKLFILNVQWPDYADDYDVKFSFAH